MKRIPTLYDDIIDSRDVIEAIRDLEDEAATILNDDDRAVFEEESELNALRALAEEGEGVPDWEDGATLIRDSYFRDYAEQLADDIGAIDATANWPLNCIDWERAANELRMDYTPVSFSGITYWVQA